MFLLSIMFFILVFLSIIDTDLVTRPLPLSSNQPKYNKYFYYFIATIFPNCSYFYKAAFTCMPTFHYALKKAETIFFISTNFFHGKQILYTDTQNYKSLPLALTLTDYSRPAWTAPDSARASGRRVRPVAYRYRPESLGPAGTPSIYPPRQSLFPPCPRVRAPGR